MKYITLRHLRNTNLKTITVIFLMIVMGFNYFGFSANAKPITISNFYIESRFILWDDNEKMIDNDFTIHLYYINESNNNTGFYKVIINNDIYNDTFNTYSFINIHMNNNDIINIFKIEINNETLLDIKNIQIISGIDGHGIKRTVSQYVISLSPFEWTAKERNIFLSFIVSTIISMVMAFRLLKYYRKKNGVKIIKG